MIVDKENPKCQLLLWFWVGFCGSNTPSFYEPSFQGVVRIRREKSMHVSSVSFDQGVGHEENEMRKRGLGLGQESCSRLGNNEIRRR